MSRFSWHLFCLAEQRETLCLNDSQKVWLLGCPFHLIPHMVVPFDSQARGELAGKSHLNFYFQHLIKYVRFLVAKINLWTKSRNLTTAKKQ